MKCRKFSNKSTNHKSWETKVGIVKLFEFVFNVESSESSSCWNMSNQTTNISAKSNIEQITVLYKKFKCSVKENKKNVVFGIVKTLKFQWNVKSRNHQVVTSEMLEIQQQKHKSSKLRNKTRNHQVVANWVKC